MEIFLCVVDTNDDTGLIRVLENLNGGEGHGVLVKVAQRGCDVGSPFLFVFGCFWVCCFSGVLKP